MLKAALKIIKVKRMKKVIDNVYILKKLWIHKAFIIF